MTKIFHIDYKIPQGKLVRLKFELKENNLANVKINGDFFAYPEEKFENLENILEGVPYQQEKIEQAISSFIKKEKINLIGINSPALAQAFFYIQDKER